MSSRSVPFDPTAICDECGKRGAFDFMGDYYCENCISKTVDEELKAWREENTEANDER